MCLWHRSLCALAFSLLCASVFVAAQATLRARTDASPLRSLADLNAAAVSSPLLLVHFDPFSSSMIGGSPSPSLACSAKCQELLSLCEGAASLPLPKRSRITCGRAQGDGDWIKGCVFAAVAASHCVHTYLHTGSSRMSQHHQIIHHHF